MSRRVEVEIVGDASRLQAAFARSRASAARVRVGLDPPAAVLGVGLALFAIGVWWIYPPAALIIVGLVLVVLAIGAMRA